MRLQYGDLYVTYLFFPWINIVVVVVTEIDQIRLSQTVHLIIKEIYNESNENEDVNRWQYGDHA